MIVFHGIVVGRRLAVGKRTASRRYLYEDGNAVGVFETVKLASIGFSSRTEGVFLVMTTNAFFSLKRDFSVNTDSSISTVPQGSE